MLVIVLSTNKAVPIVGAHHSKTTHGNKIFLFCFAGSLEITSTLLVFLLLHHSKDVRNAASNAVSRCFGASASLANDFLHSLRKWLADGAQISVLQVSWAFTKRVSIMW